MDKIIAACYRNGKLRRTKPFKKIDKRDPERMHKGCVNYCWRMLCFDFLTDAPHSCMPVTADWDIPLGYQERKLKVKELDELIKKHEATLPLSEQKGAIRWAKALGIL